MNTETVTVMSDEIGERLVELDVRHDDEAEYPFLIKVGCLEEYMTLDDVKKLRNMFAAALRKYAQVTA